MDIGRNIARVVAIVALLLAGGLEAALAVAVPAGKLPSGVTPTHYRLDLAIDPKQERFSGEVRIDVTLAEATTRIWLHGRGLDVSDAHVVTATGARVGAIYREEGESGVVRLDAEEAVGPGAVTLVFRYGAPFNRSLEGLYRVEHGGRAYAYTQFQPLSARRAFPGFDEPRFKTPFDIAITTGASDNAISNGPARETLALAVNQHLILTPYRRAKLTPPLASTEVVPVVHGRAPRGFV